MSDNKSKYEERKVLHTERYSRARNPLFPWLGYKIVPKEEKEGRILEYRSRNILLQGLTRLLDRKAFPL